MASIDDFYNLGLKTARVLKAERVGGSDKLLKLQVDVGEEQRQLVAGIGKTHNPEDLVGKTIVIASALKPRTFMGQESEGMLLAADSKQGPVLLQPEQEVLPGTLIK